MIIFDLDGTLANCEHRRHFVQAPEDHCYKCYDYLMNPDSIKQPLFKCSCGRQPGIWRCNWPAFYDACDKDQVIDSTSRIFDDLAVDNEIQIWSGRCDSVRKKTEEWLYDHIPYSSQVLKMRPIGDNTPDDQLKEKWLDQALANGKTIDFVFDDRPKVVAMWRRRGIFVFDCNQQPAREF